MIRLYTGLPGHGKTLAVIALIASWNNRLKYLIKKQEKGKELTHKEKEQQRLLKRTIIIAGIDHIKADKFHYLKFQIIEYKDVLTWKTDYHDSVIIIDECQKVFPQLQRGVTPHYINNLSTHRNNGLDIYLITQNPMLIDACARHSVDEHTHVKRLFSRSNKPNGRKLITALFISCSTTQDVRNKNRKILDNNRLGNKRDNDNRRSSVIPTKRKSRLQYRILVKWWGSQEL